MNKRTLVAPLLAILSAFSLTACFDNSTEEDIALSDVPVNIIDIVQNALPGISIDEAEKKSKGENVTYELEGKLLNGKEYEIKISDDGTIIKIKLED